MSQKSIYLLFVTWAMVITAIFLYFAYELQSNLSLTEIVAIVVPALAEQFKRIPTSFDFAFTSVFLILMWWRVFKVLVLHGTPFTFGMRNWNGDVKTTRGHREDRSTICR